MRPNSAFFKIVMKKEFKNVSEIIEVNKDHTFKLRNKFDESVSVLNWVKYRLSAIDMVYVQCRVLVLAHSCKYL